MANLYVEEENLKLFAFANEADTEEVWELLPESVSRMFDRECEVADGFFSAADEDPFERTYRSDGTNYVRLGAYVADSIETITVDDVAVIVDVDSDDYYEQDGYLIFTNEITKGLKIVVAARYGFAAVPADVQQAVIEQSLAIWRKKDLSFADVSGVSSGVINAELSPTFSAVTKRYRQLYSPNKFFA